MLWALTLTLILELSFALVWGIRKKELLLVVLMNLLTNPAANLICFFAWQTGWAGSFLFLLLEATVVITEGFCCRGMIRRPWLFVCLVNLFSCTIGVLIQRI